jgi:hypothetical protein
VARQIEQCATSIAESSSVSFLPELRAGTTDDVSGDVASVTE